MKIIPVGLSLSLFLAITFALGAALHLGLHSGMQMDMANGGEAMMKGGMMDMARHHGPAGFFIGLAVSYALGWYTALVYVPLHNLFNRKSAA